MLIDEEQLTELETALDTLKLSLIATGLARDHAKTPWQFAVANLGLLAESLEKAVAKGSRTKGPQLAEQLREPIEIMIEHDIDHFLSTAWPSKVDLPALVGIYDLDELIPPDEWDDYTRERLLMIVSFIDEQDGRYEAALAALRDPKATVSPAEIGSRLALECRALAKTLSLIADATILGEREFMKFVQNDLCINKVSMH